MEKKQLVLCDTNILIDFYKASPEIIGKLMAIGQENIAVSIITVGELLHGALNRRELKKINEDLAHLTTIHISEEIGQCFHNLMQAYSLSHRLSVPDGLIAATAITENIPLYTLNLKDFRYIANLKFHKKF